MTANDRGEGAAPTTPDMIPQSRKIYVACQGGMVGSITVRHIQAMVATSLTLEMRS